MRYAVFILVGGMLLCLPGTAFADSIVPPMPYKIIAGQYVFVMLVGYCKAIRRRLVMTDAEWNASSEKRQMEAATLQDRPHATSCASENENVHVAAHQVNGKWQVSIKSYEWMIEEHSQSDSGQEYPASGLYNNDGSITPLWTVEWYASRIYLSQDGRYLIRMGPWASFYDDLAVAFYDRNQLLKTYQIKMLVKQPERLPHSVSHFTWRKKVSLDDQAQTFTVTTLNNERYVFDITSGDIKESEQPETPQYTASIEDNAGSVLTLSNFHACRGGIVFPGESLTQGQSAGFNLYGYIQEGGSQNPAQWKLEGRMQFATIPFSLVTTVTRENTTEDGKPIWRVRLGGDRLPTIVMVADDVEYCGEMPAGKTLSIAAGDIKKLTMSSSSDESVWSIFQSVMRIKSMMRDQIK